VIVPKPSVRDLRRSARPDSSRESYLRLDRNELVPEWDRKVFDGVLAELTPASFSAYPAVRPLYEQLGASLGVPAAQLLLGAGSDWLIRACFDTFCQPGDTVVLAVPTYGMYDVYARLNGAVIHEVPYSGDFSFPLEPVLASLRERPRMLGLASPNGVLGSVISTSDLRAIVGAAREQRTLVVLDEAYLEYGEDRSLSLLPEYDNLVLVRTFSKAGGLAGLRVGYAVAQTELIGWIGQVRPNVEINQVAVVACRYLLSHPGVIRQHVEDTLAGKRLLVKRLRAQGMTVVPGAANFLQVKLGAHREAVLGAFLREDVLVKDQAGDPLLGEWTRITAGPSREMEVVARIVDAVISRG
jgi:histidinol-phosphate aminotransferase